MNTSGKCGACGTPKSKNRFGDLDCPKCYSENFVGFPPVTVKGGMVKTENQNGSDVVESEEDEKIED